MLPEVPQTAAVVAAIELLLSSLQHFISTTHRSHRLSPPLLPELIQSDVARSASVPASATAQQERLHAVRLSWGLV